jgi:hypothetical protein
VVCRGQRTQVSTVSNSVGYASASDLRIHFGLADDRRVSLEIYWPSGAVQKMPGIASDQLLQVIEPAVPLSRTSKDHK